MIYRQMMSWCAMTAKDRFNRHRYIVLRTIILSNLAALGINPRDHTSVLASSEILWNSVKLSGLIPADFTYDMFVEVITKRRNEAIEREKKQQEAEAR